MEAIFGTGKAAQIYFNALSEKQKREIACFVDDYPVQSGHLDRPVFKTDHFFKDRQLMDKYGVDSFLLAAPSLTKIRSFELMSLSESFGLRLRKFKNLEELSEFVSPVDDIVPIEVADLIPSRSDNSLDKDTMDYLNGKTVLITGIGGTIGSTIARKIIHSNASCIVAGVDNSEINMYSLMEARDHIAKRMQLYLDDVCQPRAMHHITKQVRPDIIIHAAAYKHVNIVENSPEVALRNNVLGTYNVLNAATEHGVKDFLLISTDKAVRSTNVMGKTKRLAEHLVFNNAMSGKINKIAAVRFGNVLGSSGSAVPKFYRQLKSGEKITVTDEAVNRYFMSKDEAAKLVLSALSFGKKKAMYLLDMGEPIKILDLVFRLGSLMGYSGSEIKSKIEITGLMPGEKKYEELLITGKSKETSKPFIFEALEEWDMLIDDDFIKSLNKMVEMRDRDTILRLLKTLN